MPNQITIPPILWQPDQRVIETSNLQKFMDWLSEKRGLHFDDYHQLWKWSVDDLEGFWESVWEFFEIISYTPYDVILSQHQMPGVKWFEGSSLNYAEHIFRQYTDERPAIIYQSEHIPLTEMSWRELKYRVASMRAWLQSQGIGKGDRVVAYIPNIPEASIAFLAACSLGAIWSSCSPDFGVSSVMDRFSQVEPKILIAANGYYYGGKSYNRMAEVTALTEQLPSLEKVVVIPFLTTKATILPLEKMLLWEETQLRQDALLTFDAVPFGHPIWVLYSSGTTGIPKAITHSHGGVLLEHLKYLVLQNDVKPGERFYWFSTTGWMMWNFVQGAMLAGATIVLYDGSPGYPDLNVLWEMTEKAKINHFGTSAPFLVASMKKGIAPGEKFDLSGLRSIGSTGAPLPPEAFDYVYEKIKEDVWLCSMSGGTDVCTAFVGSSPLLPVYEGEIQCRALGCALYAWNDEGRPVTNEVGEMVITAPMPSMPIFFWHDEGDSRYKESYFEMFPGVWRHGDWVLITNRKTLIIKGRSDATLNRQGVRIGTSEIYRSVNKIKEIKDSLIVNLELEGGQHYMPLFILMEGGNQLDENLVRRIKKQLRSDYSPRHVPDEIIVVPDIPYTISGKKLEAPVKKILMGIPVEKAANKGAMRNPEALDFFVNFSDR